MSAKYAILGLLANNPMHGYEIKQIFEKSLSYTWTINYGQLYPLLKKMEQGGLISKQTVQQENRPAKSTYFITETGKGDLAQWLVQPAAKRQMKDELYLKIMFMHNVNPQVAIEFLDNQIIICEKEYQYLVGAREQNYDKLSVGYQLYLESGIIHFAADLEWLKLCREKFLSIIK